MSQSNGRQFANRVSLQVEELEGRLVPTMFDLTAPAAEGIVNGAIVQQTDAQPTGTGFINSFVRLQTNATVERGFNTDNRPLQFNENNSNQFTRSLKVGDVPFVSVNGVLYREFLLDINQKSSGTASLLSLDQLRIFVGDAPNLTGYDAGTQQLAGLTAVYDLDAGGDNWIQLNARLNSGSGSGDMKLLVPASQLGTDGGKYVYLYSSFGENRANNGGFEEWAVRTTPNSNNPPPVNFSSLSGYVFVDNNRNGIFDSADQGIAGATITLSGVNNLGQSVVLVATTDDTGFYKFASLRPGIYTLLEQQPDGFDDGDDTIGTQGGQQDNDRFFDIFLAEGVDGMFNNFGELKRADS